MTQITKETPLKDITIEGDMLKAVESAQKEFRIVLGKGKDAITDVMTDQQKGERLYDLISAVQSELEELKDTIMWKYWACKPGERFQFRNKENAKEELADILAFFGDMLACVDSSAEEMAKINIRKTKINIQRQLNKYHMDTKDGKDSADLWEEIKNDRIDVVSSI